MSSQRPSISDKDIDAAAIVAIGSNLPGRFETPVQIVQRALTRLARLSNRPPLCSSLYRTKPRDCGPGAPDFVNAVAALWPAPEMAPAVLLEELLRIEAEFGRRRTAAPNEPRILDLDLICWGCRTEDTALLKLPHPRFAEREFVLAPLAELAPNWIAPGQALTVTALYESLPGRADVKILQGGCASE